MNVPRLTFSNKVSEVSKLLGKLLPELLHGIIMSSARATEILVVVLVVVGGEQKRVKRNQNSNRRFTNIYGESCPVCGTPFKDMDGGCGAV